MRAHAAGKEAARRDLRPGLAVGAGQADIGRTAGRSRRGLDLDDLGHGCSPVQAEQRSRAEALAQLLLAGEREAGEILQRLDGSEVDACCLHLGPIEVGVAGEVIQLPPKQHLLVTLQGLPGLSLDGAERSGSGVGTHGWSLVILNNNGRPSVLC
ncbi:hypothetical protein D3C85_1343880 [compost metagenome]